MRWKYNDKTCNVNCCTCQRQMHVGILPCNRQRGHSLIAIALVKATPFPFKMQETPFQFTGIRVGKSRTLEEYSVHSLKSHNNVANSPAKLLELHPQGSLDIIHHTTSKVLWRGNGGCPFGNSGSSGWRSTINSQQSGKAVIDHWRMLL